MPVKGWGEMAKGDTFCLSALLIYADKQIAMRTFAASYFGLLFNFRACAALCDAR